MQRHKINNFSLYPKLALTFNSCMKNDLRPQIGENWRMKESVMTQCRHTYIYCREKQGLFNACVHTLNAEQKYSA
jgi:hypothetical protein